MAFQMSCFHVNFTTQLFHETFKYIGKFLTFRITSLGCAGSSILQLDLWDTDLYMHIAIYSEVNMLMNYSNV